MVGFSLYKGMFKLSQKVECIPLGNESPRVIWFPQKIKDLTIILLFITAAFNS